MAEEQQFVTPEMIDAYLTLTSQKVSDEQATTALSEGVVEQGVPMESKSSGEAESSLVPSSDEPSEVEIKLH
jgi:hypothetical protein